LTCNHHLEIDRPGVEGQRSSCGRPLEAHDHSRSSWSDATALAGSMLNC